MICRYHCVLVAKKAIVRSTSYGVSQRAHVEYLQPDSNEPNVFFVELTCVRPTDALYVFDNAGEDLSGLTFTAGGAFGCDTAVAYGSASAGICSTNNGAYTVSGCTGTQK